MTRVLVCGGRDFRDRQAVCAALDALHAEHGFSVLIAGGALGADRLAADWARQRGIPTAIFMADWQHLGHKAGPLRNGRMLAEGKPELVVAFPGSRRHGQHDRVSQGGGRACFYVVVSVRRNADGARTGAGVVSARRRRPRPRARRRIGSNAKDADRGG